MRVFGFRLGQYHGGQRVSTSARWKGFVRNSRHRNISSPVLQEVGVELQLDKDFRDGFA